MGTCGSRSPASLAPTAGAWEGVTELSSDAVLSTQYKRWPTGSQRGACCAEEIDARGCLFVPTRILVRPPFQRSAQRSSEPIRSILPLSKPGAETSFAKRVAADLRRTRRREPLMPMYLCRWPNGDCSAVWARDEQDATLKLDEVGDAKGYAIRRLPEF